MITSETPRTRTNSSPLAQPDTSTSAPPTPIAIPVPLDEPLPLISPVSTPAATPVHSPTPSLYVSPASTPTTSEPPSPAATKLTSQNSVISEPQTPTSTSATISSSNSSRTLRSNRSDLSSPTSGLSEADTPTSSSVTISTSSSSRTLPTDSPDALLSEIKQMQIISPKSYVDFMAKIKKLNLSDADKFRVVSKLNKKAFSPEYFDIRVKSKFANSRFIKEISQIKDPILHKLYFDICQTQLTASEKTVFNSIPFEIAALKLFFKTKDQPAFITLFKNISTYKRANAKDFISFYNQIIAVESPDCKKILMDRLTTIFYRAPFSSLAKSELKADVTALKEISDLAYMHQKYSDEFKLRR